MKKLLTTTLVLIICLFSQSAPIAQTTSSTKFKGFLGTYHPVKGTAYGGNGWTEGESVQNAFAFGENAIISQAAYNGYIFAENVRNNCDEWDINKVYGVLRPPTEKGVINQPKDLDFLKPFSIEPGMIQGAYRFSQLAARCPQLSGVIIDDFFNDYPKLLTAENLRDIKGALLGKRVDETGRVDHSSTATTPNLKLYAVVYNHQLDRSTKEVLELIDGVSFWIWTQNENYQKFEDYIETVRSRFPGKEILAGVYIFNGKETATAESVQHIIGQSVDLYAKEKISGLLMFSAIWMSREKITRKRWDELALSQSLGRVYYPFLGEGHGRVVDARTGKPIKDALVTVRRVSGEKPLLITRKSTGETGAYRFGAWAGRKNDKSLVYEIKVEKSLYKNRVSRVRLRAGDSLQFADVRLKQRQMLIK